MILPFGKHKGLDTGDSEVSISYLEWLLTQEWVNENVLEDVQAELEVRKLRSGDRPGAGKVVNKPHDK